MSDVSARVGSELDPSIAIMQTIKSRLTLIEDLVMDNKRDLDLLQNQLSETSFFTNPDNLLQDEEAFKKLSVIITEHQLVDEARL